MAKTYDYLVSGLGPNGREVADFVNAENGDAAVREYESQGNTNVVLHTDDVVAPLMKHYALSKFFSPKEQTKLPTMGDIRRYFLFVRIGYRQTWFLTLLAMVVLAITWYLGGTTFSLVEAMAILLLLFPFLLNFYLLWFGAGARYVRLLRLIGYGRWDEALRLIPEIRLPLSPIELPGLKAQALAGLGRLDDALMTIDEIADNPDLPPYLYWMAQSVIYQESQEPEKVLGALKHAHELAPTFSLLMIAYAGMLLAVRRHASQARDILRRVRRQAIAVPTMPYLHHAEGLLALHEGRPAEAAESFSQAVRQFEPYTRWNQSLLPVAARMRSRYAIALSAIGDTTAAQQQLRIAKPILIAHRDIDLLRRCEEVVG